MFTSAFEKETLHVSPIFSPGMEEAKHATERRGTCRKAFRASRQAARSWQAGRRLFMPPPRTTPDV
jgi:hypothetical protein